MTYLLHMINFSFSLIFSFEKLKFHYVFTAHIKFGPFDTLKLFIYIHLYSNGWLTFSSMSISMIIYRHILNRVLATLPLRCQKWIAEQEVVRTPALWDLVKKNINIWIKELRPKKYGKIFFYFITFSTKL